MERKKAILVAVLGMVALSAGNMLSGYLTLLLLKLDAAPLQWNTYWSYVRALELPQLAPYIGKIKLSGYIGFGLPLMGWLAFVAWRLKPKSKTVHGDARFATTSDLAKHGMFKPAANGIVVGKFRGKLLRLSGQQFVILAAPTRSGKGVGVVIPNLLDYQESMVVLDIKQENFDLTSGWRKSQGQDVYLFNPFAEDRRTHRWNPLSYVSPDPAFRISDLQGIAAMLYPDGADQDKFWISQARNAFTAFALYLFEQFDDEYKRGTPPALLSFPTLGGIYRFSSGDGTGLKQYLQERSQKPFLSERARTAFANLLSQAEETFASILGIFKEPLNSFLNPVLDAATSDNDFLLTDVRKKKMTIYLGIQPNKLAESRLIINLFFSQLINVNTKELPQNNPALRHQCLLLMDEFTAIGKVDILAKAVSYMAGYNLRLLPIIQSMAQLDAVYGKDISRTLITNHALQIIYAPREQQDANDYSEMLGYTTVRKQNVTRGRDVSRSESEERRALMLPQELKAMGFDKEVILLEGVSHPVMCEKIKYYQDKRFTQRLLTKVEIPKLQLGEEPMASKATQAFTAAAAMALAMGCSPAPSSKKDAAPDDPEPHPRAMANKYKQNPNPKQRYDITVTIADAPGPFESIRFGANYEAKNCVFMLDRVAGVPSHPKKHLSLDFKRLEENTYVGTVYLDAMLDEDYFGNGVCHWQMVSMGVGLKATGAHAETRFSASLWERQVLAQEKVTTFLQRKFYPRDLEMENFPASGQTDRSKMAVEDADLFTVTLTSAEVRP